MRPSISLRYFKWRRIAITVSTVSPMNLNHPMIRARLLVPVAAAFFATGLFAQTPAPKLVIPAPSPTATLKQRVGLTDIEIIYSRPGVKGRKVFGERAGKTLEAWGEVWRVGANNATSVTFSTPVKIGGTEIPAGTYGLFAELGRDEWTVILNKIAKQWGSYAYDAKDDVVRVKAKVQQLAHPVETLTIDINDIRDESATLNISWENTHVAVPFQVDVVNAVQAQIEAVMASDAPKKPYLNAAMFYLDHHLDLKKALAWVDAAIAEQPKGYYIIYRKAKIQAAMGDKAGAIATANQSIAMAKADNSPAGPEYVNLNEMLLASLK